MFSIVTFTTGVAGLLSFKDAYVHKSLSNNLRQNPFVLFHCSQCHTRRTQPCLSALHQNRYIRFVVFLYNSDFINQQVHTSDDEASKTQGKKVLELRKAHNPLHQNFNLFDKTISSRACINKYQR